MIHLSSTLETVNRNLSKFLKFFCPLQSNDFMETYEILKQLLIDILKNRLIRLHIQENILQVYFTLKN